MPLEPVHKARSPKANVPQLSFADKFPPSLISGTSSNKPARFINTKMLSDSEGENAELTSPYSMNLNENDYSVEKKATNNASSSSKMNSGQWVKVDDGTNPPYLYNLQTEETKWPSPVKAGSRAVGWQLLYDNAGNAYYHNTETGDVTWDNPFTTAPSDNAILTPTNQSPENNASYRQKSSLPLNSIQGWEEAVDPATYAKYYYNPNTKESQWNTPVKNMENSPFRQNQQQQESPAGMLSPSWETAYDPETQAKYYYNVDTAESQWNTPQRKSRPAPVPRGDSFGSPHQSSGKAMAQSAPPGSLPVGWEAAVDPVTGAPYYYNVDTQESQWNTPGRSDRAPVSMSLAATAGGDESAANFNKMKDMFAQAYFSKSVGLESVPEGLEGRSVSPSSMPSSTTMQPLVSKYKEVSTGENLIRKPSPRASEELSEFLETKEATQIRKFEKMKTNATELRKQQMGSEVWIEWQMKGGGATFYSRAGTMGGQWQKPVAFENADVATRGGARSVAAGLDATADRQRIEASRLKLDKARLSRSWEHGFGGGSEMSGLGLGGGKAEDWNIAAEQARIGLDILRRKEESEVEAYVEEEPAPDRGAPPNLALAQRVQKVVTGNIEKSVQREAYKAMRMRDATVDHDLQLADMQERADRAKARWKEFVGPTFQHGGEPADDMPLKASNEGNTKARADDSDASDDSDNDTGLAIKKKRPGSVAKAAGSKSQAVDFNALYARAIVVRQRWPWTCLVDMKSDRLFYRNEVGDYFQLEAPLEFETDAARQARLMENEEYDDESVSQDRPSIRAGESASDFVTRFKDELKARRDHLLAGKAKDRVVLTNISQEKGIAAAEEELAHEKKSRGKSISASSIVSKIRSFSDAHQVMESAKSSRAASQSNTRNLFSKFSDVHAKDYLQRKYAIPKFHKKELMRQAIEAQAGPRVDKPLARKIIPAHSLDSAYLHTREKDAAQLLIRLRRMAYEPRSLFMNFREEVAQKYRKPDKADAKKGTFQEIPDNMNNTKRALAVNDLRNQEKTVALYVGICSDQLDGLETTWLESEVTRRHLLEAAVLQRNSLVFPRTARDAKMFPALPMHMATPNLLRIPGDLPELRDTHRVKTMELGIWTYYTVFLDFAEGKQLSFYHNSKTGVVQTGEPYDIKCHRNRDGFTHHKWSHYDRFIPMRSNFAKKGLHLLSDDEGGLLYYCPRRDKYSSTAEFDAEVNFASVRAALDRKNDAKKGKNKPKPQSKAASGIDIIPNFGHYQIPDIERDVLEFPEPNIWANLLRLIPPTQAPTKAPPTRRHSPGASASLLTPTGRSRSEKAKTKRPSSARRPDSASKSQKLTNNQRPSSATSGTPRSRPGSARRNETPSHEHIARRFLADLPVAVHGHTVRPFSAPDSTPHMSRQLNLSMGTMEINTSVYDGTPARGNGSPSTFYDDASATFASFGGTEGGGNKLAQLQFEYDLDAANYIDFRAMIKKISDKPRDPVSLLELANFLHSQKLGNEALAVVERALELLADWKLTNENAALCHMLGIKMRMRYTGRYEKLRVIKSVAASCVDSPVVLAHCAHYLQNLKYFDTAEGLYVAALLLDPLCNEANRGLAHLLIEKGNPNAASRYFVRVADTAPAFSMVKAEQGWLQELLGSDEEAILLAYKKSLSLGLRDRGTVCTLNSLGHFYHSRGDFARANSFYKRALMYAPCDPQTLLMIGALGNVAPNLHSSAQVDAWLRKGLAMQWGDTSRWIALLLHAESLLANFQDLARVEELLWVSVRLVFSKEIWPTISLAHYYQYTTGDHKRARRLLLWADRRNVQLTANMAEEVDYSSYREQEDGLINETPIFGDSDRAALLVAAAYTCIDIQDLESAYQYAKNALEFAPEFTCAHRVMGLVMRDNVRQHKESMRHIQESIKFAGTNAYSLRTASIITAMEGNFSQALKLMESAAQHGPNCQLAWHALGVMMYLYARNVDSALVCLSRALELSNNEDFSALLLKGQILMEKGKHAEARACFQLAMSINPSEPILLASLALSLSALGFKPPAGHNLIFDYTAQLNQLDSLGSLINSENPEEVFNAAIMPGLDFSLRKKCRARRAGEVVDNTPQGIEKAAEQELDDKDVHPDVLYWFGMYQMNKGSKKAHVKAKSLFTRAVQRVDYPPHPLALYMLGWLAELRADLVTAEKYYCYALQLEPMHPLAFLQLIGVVQDTLQFVRGLVEQIEVSEGARKKAIKRKNKMRQQGISVPVAKEGEGMSKNGELMVAKKRLLLHERVLRLSSLRKLQYGSKVSGLHAPGKCVHIDAFWLDRLLHAFTQCDDWASMLRSSSDYTEKAATQAKQ